MLRLFHLKLNYIMGAQTNGLVLYGSLNYKIHYYQKRVTTWEVFSSNSYASCGMVWCNGVVFATPHHSAYFTYSAGSFSCHPSSPRNLSILFSYLRIRTSALRGISRSIWPHRRVVVESTSVPSTLGVLSIVHDTKIKKIYYIDHVP